MQIQAMTQSASLAGNQLAPARVSVRPCRQSRVATVAMGTRKVNTVDDGWKKV